MKHCELCGCPVQLNSSPEGTNSYTPVVKVPSLKEYKEMALGNYTYGADHRWLLDQIKALNKGVKVEETE